MKNIQLDKIVTQEQIFAENKRVYFSIFKKKVGIYGRIMKLTYIKRRFLNFHF